MRPAREEPPTPEMEMEASLWAARLDGAQLSLAQRRELERWLDADRRNRPLLEGYCRVSATAEAVLRAAVAQGRIQNIDTKSARPAWWRVLPWLAAAGLAAAVAIAVLSPRTGWEAAKYATGAAQRQQVALPDGSAVELNASSSLVVEEGSADRRVRLVSGEAFFSVSRDATRPFWVETPAGVVRVTGTAFNVNLTRANGLEVTVVEGSVQVRPASEGGSQAPVQLQPGDRLALSGREVRVGKVSADEREALMAWRSGNAVFSATPLSDALAAFARYHGRTLVADPSVANLTLGGRYRLDDLEGFLSAVEALLPVTVTRDLSGVIRLSPR